MSPRSKRPTQKSTGNKVRRQVKSGTASLSQMGKESCLRRMNIQQATGQSGSGHNTTQSLNASQPDIEMRQKQTKQPKMAQQNTPQSTVHESTVVVDSTIDYIALSAALRLQMSQRMRATKDIQELIALKAKALADPIAFMQQFMAEGLQPCDGSSKLQPAIVTPPNHLTNNISSTATSSVGTDLTGTLINGSSNTPASSFASAGGELTTAQPVALQPVDQKKARKNARRREIAKEKREKARLIPGTANTNNPGAATAQSEGNIIIQSTSTVLQSTNMMESSAHLAQLPTTCKGRVSVDNTVPTAPLNMDVEPNLLKAAQRPPMVVFGSGLENRPGMVTRSQGISSSPNVAHTDATFNDYVLNAASSNSQNHPPLTEPATKHKAVDADIPQGRGIESSLEPDTDDSGENPFLQDRIPRIQAIFRTPTIEWTKYYINDAPLEAIHNERRSESTPWTTSATSVGLSGGYEALGS